MGTFGFAMLILRDPPTKIEEIVNICHTI